MFGKIDKLCLIFYRSALFSNKFSRLYETLFGGTAFLADCCGKKQQLVRRSGHETSTAAGRVQLLFHSHPLPTTTKGERSEGKKPATETTDRGLEPAPSSLKCTRAEEGGTNEQRGEGAIYTGATRRRQVLISPMGTLTGPSSLRAGEIPCSEGPPRGREVQGR